MICGVSLSVSSYAILVRLNWLPLNYVLTIHAMAWLYRMKMIPKSEVYQLFLTMKNDIYYDELWAKTLYFKPCWDMIKRLEGEYNTKYSKKIGVL